jgi:hypothetical protein
MDSLKNAKGIFYKLNEPVVQPVNLNDGKFKTNPSTKTEERQN